MLNTITNKNLGLKSMTKSTFSISKMKIWELRSTMLTWRKSSSTIGHTLATNSRNKLKLRRKKTSFSRTKL